MKERKILSVKERGRERNNERKRVCVREKNLKRKGEGQNIRRRRRSHKFWFPEIWSTLYIFQKFPLQQK